MDIFTELFEHQRALRVVICRPCAIAIPPAQITTHLKTSHPKVPTGLRKDVAASAHTLSDLAWHPCDVSTPKPAESCIAYLSPPSNSFVCSFPACWQAYTTLRKIRNHCSEKHGWRSNQQRGGDKRKMQAQPSNRMWHDSYTCQRLFRAVGWPAYIVVQVDPVVQQTTGLAQEVVSSWQHDVQRRRALQAQAIIQDSHRVKVDPWLELTAWVPHLKGFSRASMLEARELPDDNKEHDLGVACEAMRRVVRRAF